MVIVVVNPYDPLPGEGKRRGRYGMLSSELVFRGHKVYWLTSDFMHSLKRYRSIPYQDDESGVKIFPIHVPPYHRNIGFRRIVNQLVYASGIKKALAILQESAPISVVVASLPPTESARIAMEFCSDAGSIGILDMQDAWPKVLEVLFPSIVRRPLSTLLLWHFRRDVRVAANSASALVAVSPEYLSYLTTFHRFGKTLPAAVFPLGFDAGQDSFPSKQFYKDEALVAVYIGNFGRFYDLETVVRAAYLCRDKRIKFVLIGTGPTYSRVVKLARDLGLNNICFEGYLPFEQALPFLLKSDVGLVPITEDWPSNTPNKAFDYLSLGLPIVSSIKGTFGQVLSEQGFGLGYQAGDPESLSRALFQLSADRNQLETMGKKGFSYAHAYMDGKNIYGSYVDFIESLSEYTNF